MFCNYNLNGIVTKKEIDQKIIIELSLIFHQYWPTKNVFIVKWRTILICITFIEFFAIDL